ncbi:MAG: hypothetical protein OHK0039_39880 [Bacteroidia bacterium]
MVYPWYFKAALQKMLTGLPGHRAMQHLVQRHVLGSFRLSEDYVADRLAHVARHLDAWQVWRPWPLPGHVLEIGTGWCPLVPLGLYLCGIDHITSSDLGDWVERAPLRRVGAVLHETAAGHLPRLRPDRLATLDRLAADADPRRALAGLGIDLVRTTRGALPPGPFDLILSNNTLEHIPARELPPLIAAMLRALSPQGLMSHYIDMADHYSYGDPRISPLHFLRYSPRQWAWLENSLQSQNRLRASQYRHLFAQAGWHLLAETAEQADPADLHRQPLAAAFAGLHPDDLRTTYTHQVWARDESRKILPQP